MSSGPSWSIKQLNSSNQEDFQAVLGPVFEKSPWIASKTWERRPFVDRVQLLEEMTKTVEAAGESALLALIQAHPDLAARVDERRGLTSESLREQSGLFDLSEDPLDQLRVLNDAYRERFGFPFVICARLNSLFTIFDAMKSRITHDRQVEMAAAWAEIQKIAALRLADLVTDL
ncbi:MAG: 2-oxo-4-hydroxy-4-carboxy-5-ureidoimidazoline decarboxylase [Terrimicrobiaceae bacterium]